MTIKSKKKMELQLVKFKSIKIIYLNPKKQLWSISTNGVKKCFVVKIIDMTSINSLI